MWYAIWTSTGSERKLCSLINDCVSHKLYDGCFVPVIEQNKKIKGVWKSTCKPLFPGYLFVKTDAERIDGFAEKLCRIEQFAVVLSSNGSFSPISDDDTYLIENAYNNDGVLGTSIGMIEGDRIEILSGPLKGNEGYIKQINRHKRTALIEIDMFGRFSRVIIGLEIISKS